MVPDKFSLPGLLSPGLVMSGELKPNSQSGANYGAAQKINQTATQTPPVVRQCLS